MMLKGRNAAFKKEFFSKLAMIVILAIVITLVLIFVLPQDSSYAYEVIDTVVYDKDDYQIDSYFQNNHTINTGASAYTIPITQASLKDYVGSCWDINNSGYNASLTTVDNNTYRILDDNNLFTDYDAVYSVVNIPIPQNLKYLFELGLVSNVTFSAKAQSQARSIDFAVGVDVGSRHIP